MYKFTWKHVAVEAALILLSIYLVTAGCSAGWFILGLREGAMFFWCMAMTLPTAMAPFVIWKFCYERTAFQR